MAADFPRATVDTLAKRAGNLCSNPDCRALTSGPAEDEARALNVGEGAHIYGAREGAARFDAGMTDGDRASISNAIWLCRNCHKMVDGDAVRFPAELLFEWRRLHEGEMSESLGKAGALLRLKVQQRQLAGFETSSYLAQQIILDKADFWEYRLTAELLRGFFEPIRFRWEALEKGLYALPLRTLTIDDYIRWHQVQMAMVEAQTGALNKLINGEIQRSWGPAGLPGSEIDILRVCTLLRDAAERMVQWEESVRFVHVPEEFEDLKEVLMGLAGINIQKVFEIPEWFAGIFGTGAEPSGTYVLEITFDTPEGWVERHDRALKSAARAMARR